LNRDEVIARGKFRYSVKCSRVASLLRRQAKYSAIRPTKKAARSFERVYKEVDTIVCIIVDIT